MLGSLSEAEDAVQETWLRLSRSDTARRGELHRMSCAEGNLEHVMEVRQSCVAVDQKAPPDERTNVS